MKLCVGRIALVLIATLSLTIPSSMGQDDPETVVVPDEMSPTTITDVSTHINTGSGYDAWTGSVRRVVNDIYPVPGALGYGHLAYTRTYSSWFTNVTGSEDWPGGWAASYSWKIDGLPGYTSGLHVTFPDGRQAIFSDYQIPGESFARSGRGTKERLEQIGGFRVNGTVNLYLEDGSVVHFDRIFDPADPEGGQPYAIETFIARWVRDPHGLITMLNYLPIPPGADWDVRLDSVVDPTGRKLQFAYSSPSSLLLVSVTASDGQSVTYTPGVIGLGQITAATYSDGTQATYEYNATSTTVDSHDPPHVIPIIRLGTAHDTHAEGPMRWVKYSYNQIARPGLGGQISTESYFDGTTEIPVSTYVHADSGGLQTETRGDGAFSRSFTIVKVLNNKLPLLYHRTDFNGHTEDFNYDGYWYLNYFKDFRGSETRFVNECILGRPTTVTHPGGNFADTLGTFGTSTTLYSYGPDPAFPYFVYSVTDDLQKTTTYTRYPRIGPPDAAEPGPTPASPSQRIQVITYPSDTGPAPTETFVYDDFGQVTTHQLRNGYYEHAAYDGTTHLLTGQWNPTQISTPQGNPDFSYTYYTAQDTPAVWKDRLKIVTDPRGYHTQYEYDRTPSGVPIPGRGLVTKITYLDDPHGQVSQSFTYDVYGNKLTATNELQKTTNYLYDNYSRLTSVQLPNQSPTTYSYAPTGVSPYSHTTKTIRLETSPTGIATTSTYDNNLRLATKTEGSQDAQTMAKTFYGYDQNGNQTTVTSPRNNDLTDPTTTTDYDSRNRKIKVTTPAPSYNATRWKYDAVGNVTDIVRADGTLETKTYDAMNHVLVDTVPKSASESVITTFAYNPSGTILSVKDGNYHTTAFEYNGFDLKTKMTYPTSGTTDFQTWKYDGNKNLTERRTINGSTQLFGYDSRNRKSSMRWSNSVDSSDFGYDAAGRLILAANPYSTVTRQYDEAGRMTLDHQGFPATPVIPLPPVELPTVVSHLAHGGATFDIALPLTGDPGIESRSGGVSPVQYQILATFPHPVTALSNATVSSGLGSVSNWSYSGGLVTISLNGVSDAQVIKVTLVGVQENGQAGDLIIPMRILVGDVNGDGTVNASDRAIVSSKFGLTVDATNFRCDVNASGGINATDRSIVSLYSGTALPGGPGNDVSYAYNDDGRVTRLYIPGTGYDYTQTYDSIGRLKTIFPTNPSSEYYQYTYDKASNVLNRLTHVVLNDTDYSRSIDYTPDELNRIHELRVNVPTSVISLGWFSHETYGHDSMNRLTDVTREEDGLQDQFGYYLDGELKSADYGLHWVNGHWVTPAHSVTYNLDNAGNRTDANGVTVTENGEQLINYAVNPLNQYESVGGSTVTNGSEHEIAGYQGVTYTYLNDTYLAQVVGPVLNGTLTYRLGYDALGRLARRSWNDTSVTYYVYDGEHSIMEFDATNPNIVSTNVYGRGVDEIIARNNNGSAQYLMQDHEGSTLVLTGGDGSIMEWYRYDAFGAPTIYNYDKLGQPQVIPVTANNNRFMFTGREYVSQFGIYEYRARAYHPGIGRFMSEDPKTFVRGIGLSKAPDDWSFSVHPDEAELNLFRYCGNDPLERVDPSGENPIVITVLVLAGAAYFLHPDVANAPENEQQAQDAKGSNETVGMVLDIVATKAGEGALNSLVRVMPKLINKALDKITNKATSPKSPIKFPKKADFVKQKLGTNQVPKPPPTASKPIPAPTPLPKTAN
jgi:RHS repeat-associated protein